MRFLFLLSIVLPALCSSNIVCRQYELNESVLKRKGNLVDSGQSLEKLANSVDNDSEFFPVDEKTPLLMEMADLSPSIMPTSNGSVAKGSYNGLLPSDWEIAYTENGEKYYIDHKTGTTQWDDPRIKVNYGSDGQNDAPTMSTSAVDLPHGWEKVDDPQYGVYYIDHINKRTQYDKPVYASSNGFTSVKGFTRNPEELQGELITISLIKSKTGLGFTLVGSDDFSDKEEFLQIKSIFPDGPAYNDGRLKTGDILVYINGQCVLGYKQDEIIRLFQTISPGKLVHMQICRGYPLMVSTDAGSRASTNGTRRHDDAEIVTVRLVKGDNGFGFTISDCPRGQQVNTIIDKERCRGLQSGDVLLELNGRNVRNCGHTEIVEVLRQCPVGREIILHCQRRKPDNELKHLGENGINGKVSWNDHTPIGQVAVDRTRIGRPHSYHIHSATDVRSRTESPMRNDVVVRNRMLSTPANADPFGRPRTRPAPPIDAYSRRHPSLERISKIRYYESQPRRMPPPLQPIYNKTFEKNSNLFVDNREMITKIDRRPVSASLTLPYRKPTNKTTDKRLFYYADYTPLSTTTAESEYSYITTDLIRYPDGFGFRIVGGADEHSPVVIDEIVLGGSADVNGVLRVSDELIEIDGRPLQGASKHAQAVALLSSAGRVRKHGDGRPLVKLLVRRKRTDGADLDTQKALTYRNSFLPTSPGKPTATIYPFDVTIIRGENEGFGFIILSSLKRKGSVIGEIIPNSQAEKCGRLKVGDCIIAVNKYSILDMSHGEIVNLIKDSGYSVTLTIGEHDASYATTNSAFKFVTPSNQHVSSAKNSDEEIFSIELIRGARGFGFSIRGGREFSNMPVFVLRIAENGSAHVDGRLRVGDQLLEINGIPTAGMTHTDAIDLIKRDAIVHLLIKRNSKSELGQYYTQDDDIDSNPGDIWIRRSCAATDESVGSSLEASSCAFNNSTALITNSFYST